MDRPTARQPPSVRACVRARGKEDHPPTHRGRIAGSDFVFSKGLVWLAFAAPLGLSKADFAPFLKFGLTPPNQSLSPDATLGDERSIHPSCCEVWASITPRNICLGRVRGARIATPSQHVVLRNAAGACGWYRDHRGRSHVVSEPGCQAVGPAQTARTKGPIATTSCRVSC